MERRADEGTAGSSSVPILVDGSTLRRRQKDFARRTRTRSRNSDDPAAAAATLPKTTTDTPRLIVCLVIANGRVVFLLAGTCRPKPGVCVFNKFLFYFLGRLFRFANRRCRRRDTRDIIRPRAWSVFAPNTTAITRAAVRDDNFFFIILFTCFRGKTGRVKGITN